VLEAGSRAHYDDPAYYSRIYRDRTEDIEFYVRLAERIGGPVLEYGAGNGRITLPIARAGLPITAVDLSGPMLGDLRARLSREPGEIARRVVVRRGDMRRLSAERTFKLIICPFNTVLHLYDRRDFERFLARVRAHLARGGTFAFDISVPNPNELTRDPNRAYHSPRLRHPTVGDVVEYTERFDYDGLRQILFVMIEFTPVKDRKASFTTPLAHRQIYPQEMEALLHYNGLVLTEAFGDFQGGAFDRYSDTMVGLCRARRGAS
jgi:SAM-dependent methyltransferase